MTLALALLTFVACAAAADYSARRAGITGVGTNLQQVPGWSVLYVASLFASLVAMTWLATELTT